MANKTVQALKINATIVLNAGALSIAHKALFGKGDAAGVRLPTAKVKIAHAIVARYDQPDHVTRVSDRIAALKAALSLRGELEDWRVVAGAVPIEEAEFLPDPDPKTGDDTVVDDTTVAV